MNASISLNLRVVLCGTTGYSSAPRVAEERFQLRAGWPEAHLW